MPVRRSASPRALLHMTIYVVTLIVVLNHIGFSGSRVAVALYALQLGANQFSVGVIVACYSVCPMLFAITIGRFADKTGPRPMMIVGTFATAVVLLLPVVFSDLGILYATSLLLGFFHSIFSIPIEAVVGGIGGVKNRAHNYSMISMGWSGANFLGPVIAGFAIDHLGYAQAFAVLAAFALLPLPIAWRMPELLTKAPGKAGHEARGGSVLELWRLPGLRTSIIAGAVVGSAKDLFQFYMPIYGHSIELSASAIGTILGMAAVSAFLIRAIIPLLVRFLTETQILTLAVFIAAFSFIVMPVFANPYALGAISFVLGLGCGCAEPIMMALLYVLSPQGRIAEALGLHKTVRNTTQLAVPVIFGSIGAALGYAAVFLSNAAMLVVAGCLTHRMGVPTSDLRRNAATR
jgi:MFS family permease